MSKLKVGTKVRITSDKSFHVFEIGEVCIVCEPPKDVKKTKLKGEVPLKGISGSRETVVRRTEVHLGELAANVTNVVMATIEKRGGNVRKEYIQYVDPKCFEVIGKEGDDKWSDLI